MSLADDIYKEVIMDHSANPRGRRRVEGPTAVKDGNNPLCGDECHLEVRVADGKIVDIGILGEGCSISQAAGSILSEVVQGLSVEEARELIGKYKHMVVDGEKVEFPPEFEEVQALEGVQKHPVRVKCATLAWNTLQDALAEDPA